MGGAGYHIGMGDGAGVNSRRHKPGNVSHVHHQVCAAFPGDGPEFLKIYDTGIRGGSRNYHFGLMAESKLPDLVVIRQSCFRIYAVGNYVIQLTGKVGRAAVGKMAAMVQIHAENSVAGLAQGQIYRKVGLGAAVGLDVGKFSAEQPFCPLYSNAFYNVYVLAAAIVASSGITFSIFVCQYAARSRKHSPANNVFRSNEFDIIPLAPKLFLDGVSGFAVLGCNYVYKLAYHMGSSTYIFLNC